jgi:hypothetical protein
VPFPEPTDPVGSRAEVFLRYLDYFRSRLAAKLESLDAYELTRSRLASGWTPLELAKHLRYVELHWLEWGRHLGQLDVVVEVATGQTGELFSAERTLARAPAP